MIPSMTTRLWRLRGGISVEARRAIRRITDPLCWPIGSIRGARTNDRVIALTFDDGPDATSTPGVLDALAAHQVKGTFFVLMDRAEAHPEIIARIIAEGHDIGLHGDDHARLTQLDSQSVRNKISRGCERLKALTGSSPRWFRPPYGSQNLLSFIEARRCGMEVVVWAADCADWEDDSEDVIANRAISAAKPGEVLLLHDAFYPEPDGSSIVPKFDRGTVVSRVVQGLAQRGFGAASLSSLLKTRRAHRTAWFRP